MKKNYTKERVYRVFEKLLRTKYFEKISVNDICESADISRMTFYRLFEDKYDLMRNYYYADIEKIYKKNLDYKDSANEIHTYMNKHRELLHNLITHDKEKAFESYVFKLTHEYYCGLVLRHSGLSELPTEISLDIEMYTAACNYYWKKWIMDTHMESPLVLYERYMRMLPESLKPYFY